jgi:hypothetical protein
VSLLRMDNFKLPVLGLRTVLCYCIVILSLSLLIFSSVITRHHEFAPLASWRAEILYPWWLGLGWVGAATVANASKLFACARISTFVFLLLSKEEATWMTASARM